MQHACILKKFGADFNLFFQNERVLQSSYDEKVEELEEGITSVRTDLGEVNTTVRTEHSEDIASVRTDLTQVRTDFAENITSLRTDIVSLKLVGSIRITRT